MKKLFIMSLVLSTGIILSACGDSSKEEQIKGEIIQKAASAKLEKIIKDKEAVKVDTEDPILEEMENTTPPAIETDIAPSNEESAPPLLEEMEKEREA